MVSGVPAIKNEVDMPPHRGVEGKMIVSFVPAGGAQGKTFVSWRDMGLWYMDLTRGRRDTSPEMREKVAALTAKSPTPLAKMRALARFVQRDIRYVAIELGIGGHQPHPAGGVFVLRYGDFQKKKNLVVWVWEETVIKFDFLGV